jgi:hypothetical protein
VGDDEDGAASLGGGSQFGDHQLLGGGVQVGRRLVEQQDGRALPSGAEHLGQGQSLPLAR